MNRKIKFGLMACAMAAMVAHSAIAQEAEAAEYEGAPDPESYGYTVLALGIATPLTLPWGYGWDIYGLEANLLYSDCNKMYGGQLAAGANVARLDMIGLQGSALFNLANRGAYGIQLAAVNMGNRTTAGIVAGAANINREAYGLFANLLFGATDDSFYGINISGLGSAVREDMWGCQISVGANFARRVHGLQLAAAFNMTEELRGAQIGLVNYASTCSAGFQIGLVNLIMDNQLPFLPFFNCYF